MRGIFYITVFLALCLLMGVLSVILLVTMGCETPYRTLGADAIEDYVRDSGDDLVCLSDGFDSVCIQTIAGPRGPRGRDGAVVTLEVERIITETVREVFVLEVSRTEMRYHTPVGEIYVPEGAPVEAPAGVKVTAVASDGGDGSQDSEIVPTDVGGGDAVSVDTPAREGRDQEIVPTVADNDNTIWHVMYRNDNGRLTVYVYPRERDIQSEPPFDISDQFLDEIQGTKEQVNYILEETLSENDATLGSVGGVQGVVN